VPCRPVESSSSHKIDRPPLTIHVSAAHVVYNVMLQGADTLQGPAGTRSTCLDQSCVCCCCHCILVLRCRALTHLQGPAQQLYRAHKNPTIKPLTCLLLVFRQMLQGVDSLQRPAQQLDRAVSHQHEHRAQLEQEQRRLRGAVQQHRDAVMELLYAAKA
jgi:hypothetical protein